MYSWKDKQRPPFPLLAGRQRLNAFARELLSSYISVTASEVVAYNEDVSEPGLLKSLLVTSDFRMGCKYCPTQPHKSQPVTHGASVSPSSRLSAEMDFMPRSKL